MILTILFQGCKAKSLADGFIYHTADYQEGILYQERTYNSYSGEYHYREFSNGKELRNIKIIIKLNNQQIDSLYQFHLIQNPVMSNCYYEDGYLSHKSTVTFNNQKDNFTMIDCEPLQNSSKFIRFQNMFETFISTSKIYKQNFYWEYYIK